MLRAVEVPRPCRGREGKICDPDEELMLPPNLAQDIIVTKDLLSIQHTYPSSYNSMFSDYESRISAMIREGCDKVYGQSLAYPGNHVRATLG